MTITLNSTTSGSNSGSNFNFTKPSVANNDLLVAVLFYNGYSALTLPSGWVSQVAISTSSGSTSAVSIVTRVVDGTEPTTFSFGMGSNNFIFGKLYAFSGCDPVAPVDVKGTGFSLRASSATDTLSALTTRIDQEYILAACAHDTGGTLPTLNSATGVNLYTATGSSHGFAIQQFTQSPLGSTGAITWNWSVAAQYSVAMGAVALRPTGYNLPPTVDAGPDASVIYGDSYTGQATGSDPEGAVTYAWTVQSRPSGSTATISSSTTATPTFKPDKPGTYTLRCTVTDTGSQTTYDEVILTVRAEMWARVAGVAKPAQRRIRKNGSVY